jgi:hypothetical protein
LGLKRRLVSEQRDHVFACLPDAQAAPEETAALVEEWADRHDLSTWSEEQHPLARAGLSVQEDLCLMIERDGAWHLDGALLCFPSQWNLTEKLGHPAAVVHEPVQHYGEELAGRVDTFFDRLPPGRLVSRRNLSLWPTCLLWVPTASIAPELWDPPPAEGAPRLWLRSERQTLRRLPDSGAILFTIKVQMTPVSVLAERPERAKALAAWLRGPGGESRREQLGDLLNGDLKWLDQVAVRAR